MELGMIGLGRMGANMVERLMKAGHKCVVFDRHADTVQQSVARGARGTTSLADFVKTLSKPRAVWLMLPAAAVDSVLHALVPLLERDDIVIEGGNSYYHDDIRRAGERKAKGLHYVDVGVWGLERGYCHMIGGEDAIVKHLDPIFRSLAPGAETAPRTPGVSGEPSQAEHGYLHCGPNGAGHFVTMVGMMAAFAEGFNIIRNADIGLKTHEMDAETTPLREPAHYQYQIDVAQVADLWRRGSVVGSWLLDLTAGALRQDPALLPAGSRIPVKGAGRCTPRSTRACRRR
jgi:6-phosphogluconate dehydrogenase